MSADIDVKLSESHNLFLHLLQAETEDEVEAILTRAGFGPSNAAAWQDLGDTESNFTTVGNQQTDPTAALVEKIINGIDAVLMSECQSRKLDPESPAAPQSMAAAVQAFFGVAGGRLESITSTEQGRLAELIQLVAVGTRDNPSYLVIDKGEGQTPNRFPETFLSIAKSNKMRIHFVQGKFNAGGTGVLQFCGLKHNFQLIASRRHPGAAVQPSDTSAGLWGFTIVRRVRPSEGRRSSVYKYLAPERLVPRFSAPSIPALPKKQSEKPSVAYGEPLTHGTCIKLYNYQWRRRSIATTDARYELERCIQAPCLPFRITETRAFKAHFFSTTVAGVWTKVAHGPGGENKDKAEDGFPAYGKVAIPHIGDLPYSVVVFREEEDARHHPHGVFFTINGQVHGDLPADFVTKHLKLDYLSGHLLVAVNCTSMDDAVREDFFLTSRDRVRKNETFARIFDAIKEELRDHAGLKALNAAWRKRNLEKQLTDDRNTAEVFQDLLRSDPALHSLFNLGDRLTTQVAQGPSAPYVGQKFPSYFRLTKKMKDIRECPVNRTVRYEFETDAENDYFERVDSPGAIVTDPPNVIQGSGLFNGRFNARFAVPANAMVGDRIRVTVTVTDAEAERKVSPHISQFTLVATEEQEIPEPGTPPKPRPRHPHDGEQTSAALALPNIIPVEEAEWHRHGFDKFTSLRIKNDDKGGFDFLINMSNAFLLAELARAKESEAPLFPYWFKFGLTLVALGVIHDQRRRGDAPDNAKLQPPAEADLDGIGRFCDGVARIIIPIVRSLPNMVEEAK